MLRIEDMNWKDIEVMISKGFKNIIFAIGSIEQHGPHLPIKTDAFIGDIIANKVAQKLKKTLQGPTIKFGFSKYHLSFPGTISLRQETLEALIEDYIHSLSFHGFTQIIIFASHGGNFSAIKNVLTRITDNYQNINFYANTDLTGFIQMMKGISAQNNISPNEAGAHAGETETSYMLATAGNLVKTNRLEPGYLGKYEVNEQKLVFEKGISFLSRNGVLGDPTKAKPEHGEIYIAKWVDFLVKEIHEQLHIQLK